MTASLPKRRWRDMPSHAFGPERARDWIAVLPLAAIEQHGPHLPVGVDAIIAEGMAEAAEQVLDDDLPVTFLPVQQVCKSTEHNDFPGTLSLGWKEVIASWIAIGESVLRAGPRTLVMVTSHGGNLPAMEITARELRARHGMRVLTTSWGRLGRWQEIYDYGDGPMIDIHAGLAETSLMLALRPDLVDMGKARDFPSAHTELSEKARKIGYHGAAANIAWMARDLNPDGAVGNAAAATAEAGRRDIAAVAEGFNALMRDLAKRPQDGGTA
ncbi:creatinine amidohydrolase [Salinihabitans flavidus]|uniref:Creatinine amidohydrolase n=1 Tax=Salinihabitans flavidus TaxID=569882 RepID=A0A1H8V3G9_9RHOB|nr:creatininase family protein [Salinihabitans flavidus]SEP10050.1 creatinine amidohydrolase [Salinihabitans flavidus]